MAKLKEYDRTVKIPGLPDTTNIGDPQLRLFLDRIKMFCNELAISVDGLNNLNNIDAIAAALMNNQNFNSMLNKTITQTAKPLIDKNININNKGRDIPLQSIDVTPDPITVNLFTGGSGRVYESYIPGNTSAKYKGVVWSSSDSDIAIVDQSGNVTGIAVGECDVFATSTFNASISGSSKVTVINAETITVNANYQWCTDGESSSVYTESQEPGASGLIWSSVTNTVTLYADKTESEAKEEAALSVIASTESRDYITADGSSIRYWRDEESDHINDYTTVTLYPAMRMFSISEFTEPCIFCEKASSNGTTGKVYDNAFPTNQTVTDDVVREYQLKNQEVIANDLQWISDDGTDFPDHRFLHRLITDGIKVPLERTGRKKELQIGSKSDWWEYRTIPEYSGTAHIVWLYGECFIINREGGFLDVEPNEDRDGYYSDDLVDSHSTSWVEFNGKRWYNDEYRYAWLFDANSYPAWTASPCAEAETIYTEAESPAIGDDYGSVVDGTFTASGTISATGNAVYSITGENGITYYRHE